ncbi:methyl-accepting chemotaxis protein [uncultured Aquitalea sp.]|uniref:methyl-accepting chemotaxis protein n=1 Tax=uncultured Aquitalea sp. TaxID=540272 RepID=UPI0025E15ACE|nr:methyl-accepting chemotaxis protein [uncultured Aquitalea sp.]
MKIKYRLTMLAAISTLGLCLSGAVIAYTVFSLGRFVEEVVSEQMPSLKSLQRFEADVLRLHADSLLLQTTDNANELMALPKAIADAEADARAALKAYQPLDEADKALLAADLKTLNDYVAQLKPYLEATESGDIVASKSALRMVEPASRAVLAAAGKHLQYNYSVTAGAAGDARALLSRVQAISWGTVLLCLIVVSAIGWSLARSISRAISGLQGAISDIAGSLDFTRRAPADSQDELGSIAQAFNGLVDRLQSSLSDLAGNIHRVAGAATTLAETSTDVARTAEAQSEVSASVAATVQQLTVSINHVGSQAASTNDHAVAAGDLASSGHQVVSATVDDIRDIAATVRDASDSVRRLGEQAQTIVASVSVIKDIADQTNLLALNAAIEAARAGEQGRGFAVVADEVRKLAERTAAMTGEITTVIRAISDSNEQTGRAMSATVSRVDNGLQRADQAQDAISRIGSTTQDLVGLVGSITGSIREQASASTDIAVQVDRIADMAREANEGAGATSSAARQLDAAARQMQGIVAAYRL